MKRYYYRVIIKTEKIAGERYFNTKYKIKNFAGLEKIRKIIMETENIDGNCIILDYKLLRTKN